MINKLRGNVRGHAVQAKIINGDVQIRSHGLVVAVVSALLGAALALAVVYFGLDGSRLNASSGHEAPTAGPTATTHVRQTSAVEPPPVTTSRSRSDGPMLGATTPPGTVPARPTMPTTDTTAPATVSVQSATPTPSHGPMWWNV